MPDLNFTITKVEPALRGLTPLLHFRVAVVNQPADEQIHTIMLHAQIQIQAPHREYNQREKEKLAELFGAPPQWGKTLRSRLWSNTHTVVSAFSGATEAALPVHCTYDLNIAAAKYFFALEQGDVPLLFLFSGTIFYRGAEGQLQVQQVSWDKECGYRIPVKVWQELMDAHFPNSAWLYLNRDVFERLCVYKRAHCLTSWDQALERLLPAAEREAVSA